MRLSKGRCLTAADGRRWKLGEEGLKPGRCALTKGCATGSTTGAPGSCSSTWRSAGGCPKAERGIPAASSPRNPGTWRAASTTPEAPPTGTGSGVGSSSPSRSPRAASGSGGCGSAARSGFRACSWRSRSRYLCWLGVMGLPEGGVMPRHWRAAVAHWGRTSITSLALALLAVLGDLPPSRLPRSSLTG